MSDKNFVKALRKAKAKRNFYISAIILTAISLFLLLLNLTVLNVNEPWSLAVMFIFGIILGIMRIALSRRPRKTIFSKDYLEYQTEKELRLIEFDDDMDELEASNILRKGASDRLDLPDLELRRNYLEDRGDLV